MIALLAAHHGDAAAMTPEKLERDLFSDTPLIQCLVADGGDELLGYAILVPLYRAQEGKRAWICTIFSCAMAIAAMVLASIC